MKTRTVSQIIEYINKNGKASPNELSILLNLSTQIIHRHLKKLTLNKSIQKVGKPPHVYYVPLMQINKSVDLSKLNPDDLTFLNENYLYISPQGQVLWGAEGFYQWAYATQQNGLFMKLVQEFISNRKEYNKLINKNDLVIATEKFTKTFHPCFVDKMYYLDFYSLPKFGKTPLGNLVLYAKQAQDRKLIAQIADKCSFILQGLLRQEKIQALAWVPHSLPRKIPFLKELRNNLDLQLPEISFIKAYSGEIPVAQKSLVKLQERIDNAENTFFLKNPSHIYKRILVLDDAVGSGATIQAIAKKIKHVSPKATVIAFAIVGSLKGFEVIKEV